MPLGMDFAPLGFGVTSHRSMSVGYANCRIVSVEISNDKGTSVGDRLSCRVCVRISNRKGKSFGGSNYTRLCGVRRIIVCFVLRIMGP